MSLGVYIHWPYCSAICPYCDFNVVRARNVDAEPLLEAIARDIAAYSQVLGPRRADSIFLGGGTPSLLTLRQTEFLIQCVDQFIGLAPYAEITLEANPEDAPRFAEHALAGVTRFSIGLQALDNNALRALGRQHDAATAIRAVEAAAATGQRVSIDMIYAREGQSRAAWSVELREALKLPIEHLSLYQLTIEAGTAFDRAVTRGVLKPPSSDEAAALYEDTQSICEAAGFPAYEISNHARGAAARSKHNLIYWRAQEWLGLGPGAHGRICLNGARLATQNRRVPADYIADSFKGSFAAETTALTPDEIVDETLLMGLRIAEGLPRAALNARPPNETTIAELVEEGVLNATPTHLTLTPRGRLVADRIAALLAT